MVTEILLVQYKREIKQSSFIGKFIVVSVHKLCKCENQCFNAFLLCLSFFHLPDWKPALHHLICRLCSLNEGSSPQCVKTMIHLFSKVKTKL